MKNQYNSAFFNLVSMNPWFHDLKVRRSSLVTISRFLLNHSQFSWHLQGLWLCVQFTYLDIYACPTTAIMIDHIIFYCTWFSHHHLNLYSNLHRALVRGPYWIPTVLAMGNVKFDLALVHFLKDIEFII